MGLDILNSSRMSQRVIGKDDKEMIGKELKTYLPLTFEYLQSAESSLILINEIIVS